MFSVHCPNHGAEVLLTQSHIESLENSDVGIVVHWVCWCGERGSFLAGPPRTARSRAIA
jgi:hypothetical protein